MATTGKLKKIPADLKKSILKEWAKLVKKISEYNEAVSGNS